MKKSEQKISLTINAPAEKAWEVIGGVNGVDKWFAPITACRVEGDKRYCTAEGKEFTEDIIKVDDENRELFYSIPEQHLMPVSNILGIMSVKDSGSGDSSIVNWQWIYDVEESKEFEAKEMLKGAGEMGIKGIEELIVQNYG